MNALPDIGYDAADRPEIPPAIIGSIASWRRTMAKAAPGNERGILANAAADLFRTRKINRTMYPDTDCIVNQAIVDALADLAAGAGIDDDDAQLMFAKAERGGSGELVDQANGHAAVEEPPPARPEDYGATAAAEPVPASGPRFTPVAIDDVEIPTGPACLIDGILPIRGLAVFVGEPKAGKSNLAADMGFAIARATPYGGRTTLPGPVFYLTREGVLGFRRRLVAMRRHHGAEGEGVPFFMLDTMPNIGGEETDVGDLLRDLDQYIAAKELLRPRMIILDTLARCIGEGDENSARDMGRAVSRCEAIERHFECLVGLVHHVGKDPTRGARGSNALNAAADVLIVIEKHEGHSSARVEQMKDGPEGIEWTFRLLPFDLGVTSEDPTVTSSEVTACVVEMLTEPSSPKPRETKKPKAPKGVTGDLLVVIRRAIDEAGETNVSSANVPNNVRAVTRANLKRYCSTMDWQDPDGKPDSFRVMLNKTLSTLRAGKHIAFDREWTWLT